MIKLRKYKHMHVDLYRTRTLVSARVYTVWPSPSGAGGGRVYEIKTLHSNLAPEEGRGCLFEGVYNRASTEITIILCVFCSCCILPSIFRLSCDG